MFSATAGTIRKSRADVLGITDGAIFGFEIKSDSDTYERLKTQIKDYDKFCDYCYVVVGEKHIHVDKKIPDFWGIITVTNDNVILDREATLCPKVKLYNQDFYHYLILLITQNQL